MYDFDKMTDRKGTSCSKWDNMSSMFTEKGLLPLWIADMDFRCCEEAIEAMRQRVDHGIFGYTVLPDSYFESIAGWMQRRHNWTVRKEWLVTSVTVVSALNIFVQAFTKPGDGVIIQKPVYFPFEECMPKLKMTSSEATYLAWIDFSGVGLSGLELRSFLRGKARVALDEGMVFGKSGENFARINVATDRTVVRECLDRIRDNLAR